jgi:hypothetical protein
MEGESHRSHGQDSRVLPFSLARFDYFFQNFDSSCYFLPNFNLKLLFKKTPHWTVIAGSHWVLLCWDALHHKLKRKEISPWNILLTLVHGPTL